MNKNRVFHGEFTVFSGAGAWEDGLFFVLLLVDS